MRNLKMTDIMQRVVMAMITLFMCFGAEAREYELLGRIFDAESEQRLGDATISMVNAANNEELGRVKDSYIGIKPDKNNWFLLTFYAEPKDSLMIELRIDQPGYKPKRMNFELNKDFPRRMELKEPIWVVRDTSLLTAEMVRQLKEVTVTATKIKMVVKGDTLVYDASAFQLSEGSMLDALVSQLPGVELKNNGQITVNGKFVNSLLVDGKDFFNGDPNVALNNLPAYIVKNIKVYNRDNEETRSQASHDKDEDLVMDVRLKKQYQQGFIGNIEGGYGSGGSYLGRIFGIEYAKNGRIALFANLNNINNDSRGPGLFGDGWENDKMSNDGERRLLKTGIDWKWTAWERMSESGRKKLVGMDGNIEYNLEHTDLSTLTAGTQFFADGNRYSRGRSNRHNRNELLKIFNYYRWQASDWIFMHLSPTFSYSSGKLAYKETAGEFGRNPQETHKGTAIDSIESSVNSPFANNNLLLYRTTSDGTSNKRQIYTDGNFNFSVSNYLKAPGKHFNAYFDWSYRSDRYNAYDNRYIDYRETPDMNIRQNMLTSRPRTEWKVSPSLRGFVSFGPELASSMVVYYKYTSKYESGTQELFDLSEPFGTIEDATLNMTNSYHSRLRTNIHSVRGELKLNTNICDSWRFDLKGNVEVEAVNRKLRYDRDVIDTTMRRRNVVLTPDLTLAFIKEASRMQTFELQLKAQPKLADMTRMLKTVDDANPMNIHLGNPGLKKSTTYQARLTYELKDQLNNRVLKATAYAYLYDDRVSDLKIYDRESGVNRYQPINISGSYRLYGTIDFTTPIGTDRKFWLTTGTKADFINNPDYVSESTEEKATKEVVKNLSLSENLKLTWRISQGYNVGFTAGTTWRNARSQNGWFSTINAADLKAGVTGNLLLPGKVTLATDFTIYKRTGYDDEALNSTDWVWNARIERSWLKGKITTKLDAYDLLGQLSNVTARINSLGRTETWTNSMRRYVLLSVAYKFNIMPSKAPKIEM